MRDTAGLEIYSDSETLMHAEAERVVERARAAIAERGRFTVALSGGETPRRLYELLATPAYADQIDWEHVDVFWGDERCVPPAHPESNYRMVDEALLAHVPIPEDNVHRIPGEIEPLVAAEAYEARLRAELTSEHTFDLVLLGMGDDGHTASLFPDTPAVTETARWVMAIHVARPRPMWRITLTPVVLNASAAVTFVVVGSRKAARLAQVLDGGAEVLPAGRIHPLHGTLTWMVDEAAAALVRRPA
ncbi:MAG: 6-phosphogluconolactonase [Kofleriaceae bacterium]|nr:6-phosphogluconolactonase [Kofleriaceae bacterium]